MKLRNILNTQSRRGIVGLVASRRRPTGTMPNTKWIQSIPDCKHNHNSWHIVAWLTEIKKTSAPAALPEPASFIAPAALPEPASYIETATPPGPAVRQLKRRARRLVCTKPDRKQYTTRLFAQSLKLLIPTRVSEAPTFTVEKALQFK